MVCILDTFTNISRKNMTTGNGIKAVIIPSKLNRFSNHCKYYFSNKWKIIKIQL